MMPKGEFRLALSLAFALALGCITAAVFAGSVKRLNVGLWPTPEDK
jgi:hypothetical protein